MGPIASLSFINKISISVLLPTKRRTQKNSKQKEMTEFAKYQIKIVLNRNWLETGSVDVTS